MTTFDWGTALNVAFLATLTALAKGLLARGPVGATQTTASNPSTLPPATYTEAVKGG